MHKEIAKFLVQSSEDEDRADEDIVRVSAQCNFVLLLFFEWSLVSH